jgi:hypothetical protein
VIEGRVTPDWKKFISCGENKQSLIIFLGDYIVKHINQNSSLQEGQSLYLPGLFSNPETVKMLNQNSMYVGLQLFGKHTRRGGYPHNFACTVF